MIVTSAGPEHVKGIAQVCSKAYRLTYALTHSESYIERVIQEFYNEERIFEEVMNTGREWCGYFVALENNKVIGAGGGGMISENSGEIFVLYIEPERRNEGIGSALLEAITKQQKESFGAEVQWVSVQEDNEKGIPFYEARSFQFSHKQPGYGNSNEEDYVSLRYYREI